MSVYLDVACIRIQQYLARTPTLRGRRAASAVLAEATRLHTAQDTQDAPPLLRVVAGLAEPNEQAGVADGVASLVVRDGVQPEQVARRVLAHLRAALPGATFQAVWGEGPSYVDAYNRQIKPRLASGREVLLDLPPLAEFPPVSPCRFCRSAPASTRLPVDPFDEAHAQQAREQDACADCEMRYGTRASRRAGRTAEERLARQIGRPRAADLAALAALGRAGRGGNHLATVYADGNAIGEFFTALGKQPGADKNSASRRLVDATWDALGAATRAIAQPDDSVLCAVPHVVGGDDVLVSVPADRGWRFAAVLLAAFEQSLARIAQESRIGQPPTVSAGIVFARADYPFHLVVASAEASLRRAKNAYAGRRTALDFLDVTAEGHDAPAEMPPTLAALRAHAPALDRLVAAMPAHQRTRQEGLRRLGPDWQLEADAELARLGLTHLLAPFQLPAARGDGADTQEIGASQALRIARWWHGGIG